MINQALICYGTNSPFASGERRTIEAIYDEVSASDHPQASALVQVIRQQMATLEWLGETMAQYPSPMDEQTLGQRQRSLNTLIDTLSRSNPANFEFFLPTRALLGRALVMAESNFYRLLRYVCEQVIPDPRCNELREQATHWLRLCLYTKLVEEVLSAIASDNELDRSVRGKAVEALAQIWERRLTYRVRDFFPLIEATWEARQRVNVTGGTLHGTQEIFELFQAGADPKFVDYFARADHTQDEVGAFREFLFGASCERLNRMAREMEENEVNSVTLSSPMHLPTVDAVTVFYEFFRSRQLQAAARKMANQPGPKRTAEEYVMIYFLEKSE